MTTRAQEQTAGRLVLAAEKIAKALPELRQQAKDTDDVRRRQAVTSVEHAAAHLVEALRVLEDANVNNPIEER